MSELPDRIPRHVAIVMDGNGRWARRRGLRRVEGHKAGAETVRTVVHCCREFGIEVLTLYAFSTENWKRPRSEVNYLMRQLRRFLKDNRPEMIDNGIRLRPIGALDELPAAVRRELATTVEATSACRGMTLALALNYGARRELTDAARTIAHGVAAGKIAPDDVDEDTVARHLYTAGLPDPDLLIRTAGEMRLSNFLLWQISYAEVYVTETLWPDFGRQDLLDALTEFAVRERRYGGLSGDSGRTGRRRAASSQSREQA